MGKKSDRHDASDQEQPPPTARVEYGLPPQVGAGMISSMPAGVADRQAASAPAPNVPAEEHARAGDALYGQGQFLAAAERYGAAIKAQPESAEYHFWLALCWWAAGRHDLAGGPLQRAASLAPRNPAAHEALGQWYFEAADLERALHHSDVAVRLAPQASNVIISRAVVLEGAGRADEAWRIIEPLVQKGTPDNRLGLVLGRLAPVLKREPEALSFIERRLAAPELSEAQKAPMRFAAAALLDRAGRFDEAFENARLAKQATRRPYDPADHSRRVDRLIDFFNPSTLRSLPRARHGSRRPVFVVGMPRSGTSLVEQILASHPQVFGAGELAALSRIANAAARADWSGGQSYPRYLSSLTGSRAEEMAEKYLSFIRGLNGTATYLTDKMPTNFLFLGLIELLFPECHIVHCTRNPLDTCLSCFMTYFANGHEFSHDLSHLGTYYRDYSRLMAHWRSVLGIRMTEVKYEEVVADLEGQARGLLEFLGLPWDDRCLRFHHTARTVPTASSAQVRRPLYTTSMDRWKHYEKHLGGLIDALRA